MDWCVGMTTSPRLTPTIQSSLRSVKQAGWPEIRIFAEPMAALPDINAPSALSERDQKLGAFPNWYLGLTEMYLRNPRCEAYAMFQDDLLLAPSTRDYLENSLWPAPEIGVVSLYCPSHDHQQDTVGFRPSTRGWKAWGALAYVFSNPGLRAFLSDPVVLNHRHHGPADGLRNIDSVVGSWCQRANLPYFVHIPSLVQHTGDTSTIWRFGRAIGNRRALKFNPSSPPRTHAAE